MPTMAHFINAGRQSREGSIAERLMLFLVLCLLIASFIFWTGSNSVSPFATPIRWMPMKCTGSIVGPGQPGMVRISYTYSFAGIEYTSTRYSLESEEMPEGWGGLPIRWAHVNPDNPSQSVLTVSSYTSFHRDFYRTYGEF